MFPFQRKPIAALLGGLALVVPAARAQVAPLEPVVVTAERDDAPLQVVTDPRKPRQPLPAHDGADYLKTIPGFSVIRKGGTDGDPVLRGMAGSRLGILLDGEHILGGCGGRMDPPTAYVFPEAYDRITVLKGPQTVLHGAGNSAGVVLFEREPARYAEPGVGPVRAASSAVVRPPRRGRSTRAARNAARPGARGRHPLALGRLRRRRRRARALALHALERQRRARLDAGRAHARRARRRARATARPPTPTATMDGVDVRARERGPALAQGGHLAARGRALEAQRLLQLRRPRDGQLQPARLHADGDDARPLGQQPRPRHARARGRSSRSAPRENDRLRLGIDWQANDHTVRSTTNQLAMPYEVEGRARATPSSTSAACSASGRTSTPGRCGSSRGCASIAGRPEDLRSMLGLGKGAMAVRVPNPTAGEERRETLASGFARLERDLAGKATTLYAGLGQRRALPRLLGALLRPRGRATRSAPSARGPSARRSSTSGVLHRARALERVAGRLRRPHRRLHPHPVGRRAHEPDAHGGRREERGREDARARGGPGLRVRDAWKADATLAWVRGDNDTDGTPLAQQPPLEARFSLAREGPAWSLGALLRAVARQDRVDPGKGNIAGQDIGPTAGFAIFSVNAGWRLSKAVTLTGGVDNVFDRTYAEHLSRAGAMVPGLPADDARERAGPHRLAQGAGGALGGELEAARRGRG